MTLLEAISNLEPGKRHYDKLLRIPIHKVYKIKGVGTVACGKITSGTIRAVNCVITVGPLSNVKLCRSI